MERHAAHAAGAVISRPVSGALSTLDRLDPNRSTCGDGRGVNPRLSGEINMETSQQGSHHRTYQAIFQHPVSRNLSWRDVCSMLDSMPGIVQVENEQTRKVSRNGHNLILHRPDRKNITDVAELMKLRRFLEQSEAPVQQQPAAGAHLLVVIDHRLARIYQAELHGSVPQRVIPYDRGGFGRHLHRVEEAADGKRKPEDNSFYDQVIRTLEGAEMILLFGSGTGASSAMEQLFAELKKQHKELAKRVVGLIVVDEQHLSEDQLLAKAREVYASAAVRTGETNG
jgi:hypothetical protein